MVFLNLNNFLLFSLHLAVSIFTSNILFAQDVYTWTDKNNVQHFGVKPPNSEFNQKANLPEIKRENLSSKINNTMRSVPVTCETHGGIDCALGADSRDGSVFCSDGFMDSALQFSDHCTRAKLDPVELLLTTDAIGSSAKKLKEVSDSESLAGKYLFLTIRNTKGAKAENVDARIRNFNYGLFQLSGPREIEAFGIADYHIAISELGSNLSPYLLRNTTIKVICGNCN